MEDTRPRVTPDKPVDLEQLTAELGAGLTRNEDTGEVVIADEDAPVTQADLEAAVAAHTAEPEPAPVEPLTNVEITALRALITV